ncbi:MAG: hypothetical protein JXR94_07385 [Candidatus Hydrogenedentes bacterium]|nr:hypothetical protein [Candidatus Hydrogenedentota bacterium]
MNTRKTALALVCLVATASLAVAQSEPAVRGAGPGPWAGKQMGPLGNLQDRDARELIEMVMMVRLSKELELADEQTVVLVRKFQQVKEKVEALKIERATVIDALRASVRKGDSDAVITAGLDRLIAIDRQVADARIEAFQDIGKDLTPTQQAKLYMFIQEFEEHIRRLVARAREYRAAIPEGPDAAFGESRRERTPGQFRGGVDEPGAGTVPGGPWRQQVPRRRLEGQGGTPTPAPVPEPEG